MARSAQDDITSPNKLENSPSSRLSSQLALSLLWVKKQLGIIASNGGSGNIRAGSRGGCKTLCSKTPSFRARSSFCGWFVVMAISGPNRLAIVVWAPASEKACQRLESGPGETDFLCWSSQSVASIFSLCCYEKKTYQTHEWVQKGKLQVLVVLKSTGNFTRGKLYPRLIEEK